MRRMMGVGLAAIVVVFAVGMAVAQGQAPGNLLRNPGFEGEPVIWENAGEVKVVPEWEPFHWDGLTGYPGIDDGNLKSVPTARPEYRPATLAIDPVRVHGGSQSQMWFSFYRNHYAGVLQRNVSVQAGQVYTASVWAQAWSSNGDDPRKSEAEIYLSIGINPRGDCSLKARDTVWSAWEWVGATYKRVVSQPVSMKATTACLIIAGGTKYSVKHNDLYLDDAEMALVPASGGSCPECPACSTPEPCPTIVPGPGSCPSLEEIRTVLREELRSVEWVVK